MSTTSSLRTAVEYSMSKRSLIFCIRTTNKLQRGVNLEWISAFSRESETLFPPLTYLQPTGRTQVGCRYPTVTHRYLSLPHPPARRRSPSVSAAARRPPTPRPTRSAPASSADSRCRAPAGGRGWRHALHHRRGHRHHRLNGKQLGSVEASRRLPSIIWDLGVSIGQVTISNRTISRSVE